MPRIHHDHSSGRFDSGNDEFYPVRKEYKRNRSFRALLQHLDYLDRLGFPNKIESLPSRRKSLRELRSVAKMVEQSVGWKVVESVVRLGKEMVALMVQQMVVSKVEMTGTWTEWSMASS